MRNGKRCVPILDDWPLGGSGAMVGRTLAEYATVSGLRPGASRLRMCSGCALGSAREFAGGTYFFGDNGQSEG